MGSSASLEAPGLTFKMESTEISGLKALTRCPYTVARHVWSNRHKLKKRRM
jgi:hypothetical protein